MSVPVRVTSSMQGSTGNRILPHLSSPSLSHKFKNARKYRQQEFITYIISYFWKVTMQGKHSLFLIQSFSEHLNLQNQERRISIYICLEYEKLYSHGKEWCTDWGFKYKTHGLEKFNWRKNRFSSSMWFQTNFKSKCNLWQNNAQITYFFNFSSHLIFKFVSHTQSCRLWK